MSNDPILILHLSGKILFQQVYFKVYELVEVPQTTFEKLTFYKSITKESLHFFHSLICNFLFNYAPVMHGYTIPLARAKVDQFKNIFNKHGIKHTETHWFPGPF